jgi:energy-coupling factor transport system permease protein
VIYRRRASPLHAARAAVASAWCLVASVVALSFDHPVVLAVLLCAVIAAGEGAGVGKEVRRGVLFGLPFALIIALINPLVAHQGITVLLRSGEVPVVGNFDVTLEATAMGGILGLRALILVACFALHSAAVDPDELLRSFRRLSFRSALTAALATRMIPVLARDARRLAEAQRCRPGPAPSRVAVVRAVATGALDRAVDVAATLEVRGYGGARRPAAAHRPWSRHDLAFAVSAAGLAAVAICAHGFGLSDFAAYPRLAMAADGGVALVCVALAAIALAPFLDRRGIG